MARMQVDGLDEAVKSLVQMGEATGATADAMLLAGAAVIERHWINSAQKHRHIDTGEMIASIRADRSPGGIGESRKIDVYPRGRDRRGTRNAEKAFILEHGSSSIMASRWVTEAEEGAEEPAVQAMLRVFDRFIETGRAPTAAAPAGHRRTGRK